MDNSDKNEHSSKNTTVIRVPNPVHADLRRYFKSKGIKLGHGVTNIITEFLNAQPKNP